MLNEQSLNPDVENRWRRGAKGLNGGDCKFIRF